MQRTQRLPATTSTRPMEPPRELARLRMMMVICGKGNEGEHEPLRKLGKRPERRKSAVGASLALSSSLRLAPQLLFCRHRLWARGESRRDCHHHGVPSHSLIYGSPIGGFHHSLIFPGLSSTWKADSESVSLPPSGGVVLSLPGRPARWLGLPVPYMLAWQV